MVKITKLNLSKDEIAKRTLGITFTEAQAQNICIKCRQPFTSENVRTPAEQRETKMSGMCGLCFDELFEDS